MSDSSGATKKPMRLTPRVFWLSLPLAEIAECENVRSDAIVSVRPRRQQLNIGHGDRTGHWVSGAAVGLATGETLDVIVSASQVMRALASPMLWDESAGIPVVDVSSL